MHRVISSNMTEGSNTSYSYEANAQFVGFSIILPIIATLGIFGNLTSVKVLSSRSSRNVSTLYLMALAVCDSIFLLCAMLILVPEGLYVYHSEVVTTGLHSTIYQHTFPVIEMGETMLTSYVLVLGVDRYIMFKYPSKAVKWFTHKRAIKITILVFCFCFLARFLLIFTFQDRTITSGNEVITVTCLSDLFLNASYRVYVSYISLILYRILPYIGVILFMILTLPHTVETNSPRLSYLKNERMDYVTVAITVLFLLLTLPSLVGHCIAMMSAHRLPQYSSVCDREIINFFTLKGLNVYTRVITQLLLVTNSSVKLILYLTLSRDFRKRYQKMWPCCRRAPDNFFPLESLLFPPESMEQIYEPQQTPPNQRWFLRPRRSFQQKAPSSGRRLQPDMKAALFTQMVVYDVDGNQLSKRLDPEGHSNPDCVTTQQADSLPYRYFPFTIKLPKHKRKTSLDNLEQNYTHMLNMQTSLYNSRSNVADSENEPSGMVDSYI